MSNCSSCNNDRYKLIGCCGGHECGCRGLPVAISNCLECNADNDKGMSPSLAASYEYIHQLEFIKLENKEK